MSEEEKQEQTGKQTDKAKEPSESAGGRAKAATKREAGSTTSGETPGKGGASGVGRRRFFSWLALGWVAFAGANAMMLALIGRFMFPNVLFEPSQTFLAGTPEEYPLGEVSIRWKEKHGVWLVRTNEYLFALSTICTHLGCSPNWLATENKFKCPCHGSGFYKSGINFEGPAPRPLERYRIVLTADGQILVDKTQTFQQEKGQWTDPESYLVV